MFKRSLLLILAAVVICGGSTTPVAAKMYKYTDRAGQDHFVDSPSKIPQEYRERQEEIQPVRNESSAFVPSAPKPAAKVAPVTPAGAGKQVDPDCERKREQAQKDLAEYQKKAADWEKEHKAETAARPGDSSVEKAAQVAIEKCLGGGANIDPAKAMEAIQNNASCISQVTKDENVDPAEKSDNPYMKRMKSAMEELDRLKTKCGG